MESIKESIKMENKYLLGYHLLEIAPLTQRSNMGLLIFEGPHGVCHLLDLRHIFECQAIVVLPMILVDLHVAFPTPLELPELLSASLIGLPLLQAPGLPEIYIRFVRAFLHVHRIHAPQTLAHIDS